MLIILNKSSVLQLLLGANYVEVNESLSRKDDVLMRTRISRKEAKETIYWLRLLHETHNSDTLQLINEAEQIKKILSNYKTEYLSINFSI